MCKHLPIDYGHGCADMFRFQIIDTIADEPEGVPYLDIGRCLNRITWLNSEAQERRYSLKPIRVRS
jgi:hypothetical protein